ncbi:MAG: hypothetical protein CME64_07460 [Halobacteriovoraceae bacterium]|nr:hypothetical protein [Halobacteriovoraceae bacterium]|tara:strand:- start:41960 stop:43153 length:1194 start_codon:yes stop_codon:yes gene_type:complete
MENISHSVVGLSVGELVHRILPAERDQERQEFRRKILLFISIVCASFPDLDILLINTLPEPLGYLLHHRGHTHTLVYLIPQALIVLSLFALLSKKFRKLFLSGGVTGLGVTLCVLFNFMLHITLDSLNSYGIHPFFPFNNEWLYGDLVFIVEPFFWIAFGAPLIATFLKKKFKWILGLFIVLSPIALSVKNFLPTSSVLFLLCMGSLLYLVQRKTKVAGLCGSFVMLGVFLFFLNLNKNNAKEFYLSNIKPDNIEHITIALNPTPTQLNCWQFSSVGKSKDQIITTRGIFSLGEINDCPKAFLEMSPVKSSFERHKIYSIDETNISKIRSMFRENCFFNAWTRFARVPILKETKAWDGRFQRGEQEENFSTIRFDQMDEACPESVPPWVPPLHNFLI